MKKNMKRILAEKQTKKISGGAQMGPNVSGQIGTAIAPGVLQHMIDGVPVQETEKTKKD